MKYLRQCLLEKPCERGGVTRTIQWIPEERSAIGYSNGEWVVMERWQKISEREIKAHQVVPK